MLQRFGVTHMRENKYILSKNTVRFNQAYCKIHALKSYTEYNDIDTISYPVML